MRIVLQMLWGEPWCHECTSSECIPRGGGICNTSTDECKQRCCKSSDDYCKCMCEEPVCSDPLGVITGKNKSEKCEKHCWSCEGGETIMQVDAADPASPNFVSVDTRDHVTQYTSGGVTLTARDWLNRKRAVNFSRYPAVWTNSAPADSKEPWERPENTVDRCVASRTDGDPVSPMCTRGSWDELRQLIQDMGNPSHGSDSQPEYSSAVESVCSTCKDPACYGEYESDDDYPEHCPRTASGGRWCLPCSDDKCKCHGSTPCDPDNLPDPLTPHPTRCGPCKNTNIKWTWCLDGGTANDALNTHHPELTCERHEDGYVIKGKQECVDTTNCVIDTNVLKNEVKWRMGFDHHRQPGGAVGSVIKIYIIPIWEEGGTSKYVNSENLIIDSKKRLAPSFGGNEKLQWLNGGFHLKTQHSSYFWGACIGDSMGEINDTNGNKCKRNVSGNHYIRRTSHIEGKFEFILLAKPGGTEPGYDAKFTINCTDGKKPPQSYNYCKIERYHSCGIFESIFGGPPRTESKECNKNEHTSGSSDDEDDEDNKNAYTNDLVCEDVMSCCQKATVCGPFYDVHGNRYSTEEKTIKSGVWNEHLRNITDSACEAELKAHRCYYEVSNSGGARRPVWKLPQGNRVWDYPFTQDGIQSPFWISRHCHGASDSSRDSVRVTSYPTDEAGSCPY